VKHQPVDPFLQLMMVLPPDDQVEMVPKVLHLMKEGSFQEYFPQRIEIDLGGKKKEWEGIVKIPLIPYKRFQEFYTIKKTDLCPRDARRNIRGKTFSYHCPECSTSSSAIDRRLPCIPPIIQTLVLPH
jgi:5'-3' exonuclease